jgi:transketolase
LQSFNWHVDKINGNDLNDIHNAINKPKLNNKPHCIILKTTKGFGVSFMENNNYWHSGTPDKAEYEAAIEELNEGN